ncbi:hypothetical protein EHM76_04150 [bacterium]|nr:MAG: hypothetical protein EHM76_04150 [bacterium]
MHDYALALALIRDQVGVLERRDPMPGTERIALWLDARGVRTEFDVVLHDLETDATDALIELTRATGEDAYDTPLGPVYVGWTQPSERWEGYRLIDRLARDVMVRDTAEIIRAVPVDVLRETVAGCQTDALTSSKWRKTGLKQWGLDPKQFFDRDDPRPIIRAGVHP